MVSSLKKTGACNIDVLSLIKKILLMYFSYDLLNVGMGGEIDLKLLCMCCNTFNIYVNR